MAAEAPKRPPSPWTAAILGVVLGQVGYVYTRQTTRFLVSMLVGMLVVALSFGASLHQFPAMFDPQVLLDDPQAWIERTRAALFVPTVVCMLNNLVCAADLYWQAARQQAAAGGR